MKLIKIFHKFRTQSLAILPSFDVAIQGLLEFIAISAIAAAVWLGASSLQAEKRFYIIVFLYLAWLLKFLILDLSTPKRPQQSDSETKKKLLNLQNRFQGVLQFLKQTTVNKHGQTAHLNQLPWYLLLGPTDSGKTTFLANSKVHFVLQRQPQPQTTAIASSENCDWWVTRDASIIDVPGKYIHEKPHTDGILWKHFLRLIKKQRGKQALNGIIIALSLPEIMKQGDAKKYQLQLRHLFLRIHELRKFFPQYLPCYLVITKCDLLTGFTEFFSESSDEEITQAWGLTIPRPKLGEKIENLFTEQFDSLIKKLNQQLLWRLHQERNPMARPYIKDFPLQIERLKEFTLDFIKKLTATNLAISLQGVYLTSAHQEATEPEENIVETQNTTQRAVQLFKAPAITSRAYFIKQFILQGMTNTKELPFNPKTPSHLLRYTAYATSIAVISFAALIFGKDFGQGIKQAYSIQHILSEYQFAIQQTQDPDEHLAKTLLLLNTLQQAAKSPSYKLDVLHLLTFYSNKSQIKSNSVYHHALKNLLLPELMNYLGDYLKTPVNKNTENVYAALKAYLMLGDKTHLQPNFVVNTMITILPKSINTGDVSQLMSHIKVALKDSRSPLPLNNELIQETRHYLLALPSFQLSYIILKNTNNNSMENDINLGTNSKLNNAFVSHHLLNQIPQMFTAKAFTNIFSQETVIAAQETALGNWVLGNESQTTISPDITDNLLQQLRNTYISNYIDTWESILTNIHLAKTENLAQTDAVIINLISNESPLLQLLQTLHDNTYFEPITSSSPKLQNLGLLVDKTNASNAQLYQILSGLQSLHLYIQTVLIAENEKKAAFDVVAIRMQHTTTDSITQLRLIAEKSPEPVKNWLDKIANDAWRFLLQDATHYIDTSWQEQVSHVYEAEIANHYPFSPNATQEVALTKFTDFFGNPGVVISFYDHYLLPFIDTATPEWHWKSQDNLRMPFSDDTLRQLQYALRIHHMFFPNGDNKLHVQFALEPYQLSKNIKNVKLHINDKKIVDQGSKRPTSHLLAWPNKYETKMTSVQYTTLDKKTLNRDYPGDWGWFKLVNQSFISAISHKTTMVNFSDNNDPVKYMLYTQGQFNPFLSPNLQNFHLPTHLTNTDKSHA